MAQLVKSPPSVRETWVSSLGWEDPLEKGRLPTPVSWPGLYRLWGRKVLDTPEWLSHFMHTPEKPKHHAEVLAFKKNYSSVSWGLSYFSCVLGPFSPVWLFVIPWMVARQAPLSMGFSRQEYQVGYNFLLQGIFPTQESNPCLFMSTALALTPL